MVHALPQSAHHSQAWRTHQSGGPASRREFASMTALYELDDECAFEFVNRTVHDVMHLGWVPAAEGEYELRITELIRLLVQGATP